MAISPLPNEQDVLAKIAEGDQYAFTLLFKSYQQYIFVYGRKLTRSDEMAEEIVQDVFLKLWINREVLKSVDNIGAYLNTLTKNHSLNVLRKLARAAKSDEQVKMRATELDNSTVQQLNYNETKQMIDEVVAKLPEQQRRVYTYCHIEGMKYEEVAAEMNISARTVQAHMTQALKKIREHLRDHAVAYPLLAAIFLK